MEFPSWAVLALTCLAALALLSKLIKSPKKNLPPGPKPWPIIGNIHLMGSIPHQSLHSLSKKYGHIMQLKFGSFPVVVASSPEMAKQFLKTHDSIFASRPSTAAGKYASYNFSDMTWAPYGPYWRQARKIYLNELFNLKRLDSYEYIRVKERCDFISRLYGLSGKPVFLRDHLCRHSLTTISRMVLSNEYFSEYNSENSIVTVQELQEMLNEWFLLGGVFNIGDWIPWLSGLDLQGYVKRMKGLNKKFDRFFNHVLNDHKAKREATGKDFVANDMVDVLLELAEDPNLEVKLTSDCVKGLVQDLLSGGTDTASTTVEWAIYEVLRQSNILKKATEELDKVIGRERWVEERDFPELPYIDAIVKETLRLHPLATLLAPHFSIEDCNVAGYDISKGTTVLVNTWSVGRDPKYWDSPEEFSPERFLEKDIDMAGQNFALLPFGSGRRKCPGYRLGLKMVYSTMANLLHGFIWKLSENKKPEDICMDEFYGLTTHPKVTLSVVMEPRLPLHLFINS